MSSIADLWDALRGAGLETLASQVTYLPGHLHIMADSGIPIGCHQHQMFWCLAEGRSLQERGHLLPDYCEPSATLTTDSSPSHPEAGHQGLRQIQRGLGVSQLEDSFNTFPVGDIHPQDDGEPFSVSNTAHCRDMVVVGLWFMLCEAEMAGARARDIKLEGHHVTVRIPLHKTDCKGHFPQCSLSCSCGVRNHNLCVWHSVE